MLYQSMYGGCRKQLAHILFENTHILFENTQPGELPLVKRCRFLQAQQNLLPCHMQELTTHKSLFAGCFLALGRVSPFMSEVCQGTAFDSQTGMPLLLARASTPSTPSTASELHG